jgi:nicotinate phosphoribosyltransferase
LSGVYKLVALREDEEWRPRIKISSNLEKATDPGRKNLVRYFDRDGRPLGDMMYFRGEAWPREGTIEGRRRMQPQVASRIRNAVRGEELLQTVFEQGRRVAVPERIEEVRRRALNQMAAIPDEFKRLRNPELYRVLLSQEVGKMKEQLLLAPDS